MPPWDNKFVCQSYLVNKILKQAIEDETTKKTGNNQKFSKKLPEESVEAI